MSKKVFPNFLFIGPDKTGSSWMYEILAAHPQCFVPVIKDLYFFDRYYDRGLDWYLTFFEPAPDNAIALGELSHDYLFSPAAAQRIEADLPDVRLMTCLRNPVDRSFSHYLYLVRSGLTKQNFEQALDAFPELVNNSLYGRHLKTYLNLFPRERILALQFDDLKRDSRAFAETMFNFLGLPYLPDLPYNEQVRPASRPRSHALARIAKQGANFARDLGLARLVGILKDSPPARVLYRPYGKEEKPRIMPETRKRLADVFADDIDMLEGLLNDNFQHWLDEAA